MIPQITGSMHPPADPVSFLYGGRKKLISAISSLLPAFIGSFSSTGSNCLLINKKKEDRVCKTIPSKGTILTNFEIPVFPLCAILVLNKSGFAALPIYLNLRRYLQWELNCQFWESDILTKKK